MAEEEKKDVVDVEVTEEKQEDKKEEKKEEETADWKKELNDAAKELSVYTQWMEKQSLVIKILLAGVSIVCSRLWLRRTARTSSSS